MSAQCRIGLGRAAAASAARVRRLLVASFPALGGLVIACAAPIGTTALLAAEEPRFEVTVDSGFVSIEAREAPLAELLRAVGEQAGVAITIGGEPGPAVTAAISKRPVAEALKLLLRDAASAAVYQRSAGRLVELRVRLRDRGATTSASADPPADAPLRHVQEAAITPYDWHEDRLAFVRGAVRAPREGALSELTTLLLEDDDADIRGSAAAALGRLRSEEAGEALSLALGDQDHRVRRAAARAFGAFGGERSIEALGQVLATERAPVVRQMAAWALSRMEDPAALDALQTARRDRDRIVRRIAAVAVSRAEE